ncbi:MAG: DoxX family protein [Desulfuromonas sp.]|uniref:MauE/DoxX family redox-associated membrane protein n=1 Tax=Desulfuromonas sp. TaxID=892 RepID=UPI000CA67BD6|nr:MauE/DoxX family redox-associated membrane protein [Desulfuromonas sp.]PLX82196.1 MAG: DoxX family protein [Desulfuromonas sp.]
MNRFNLALSHCCRLLLGGLFLYAGLLKSIDVSAFAGDIANYRLLPYSLNYLVAATLPYVEVLAGVLLIVNRKVRPAALLLGLLTLVFMAALASALYRGLDIDCGCFREAAKTTPGTALLRDAGILALAGITYRLRSGGHRSP